MLAPISWLKEYVEIKLPLKTLMWKLTEAGIKNAVGLFGCKLTKMQIEQLLNKRVENIILCLDNDEAGKEAEKDILDRLHLYFNLDVIHSSQKDMGDTSIEEIQTLFKGQKWL